MTKRMFISSVAIILAMLCSKSVLAADLDYYDRKDRSYIDKTLDDFERRTGQYRYTENLKDGFKPDNKYSDYKYDKYGKGRWHKNQYDQDRWNKGHWKDGCLPQRKVRRRLIKRGWHDFEVLNEGPRRVRLLATNYNGRRFKLVIHRCSGEILRRKPVGRYWGGWN